MYTNSWWRWRRRRRSGVGSPGARLIFLWELWNSRNGARPPVAAAATLVGAMAANSSCLSDLFEREESGGGFYIGVIISLLSSTSTNFGANVQKFALNREATKPILKQRPMYVIPLWIAGFALFLSSQVGDAVALAFAPQSVVQPVGSISLLANMFFGWWLNGEPIGRWTPVAMLIIIGGVGSIVSFGPKETVDWNFEQIEDRWSSPEMTLYVLIVGGLTFSLLALLVHYDRRLERQRARLRAQERQLLKAATAASPGTTPPALVPSLRGSGAAEHLRVLETPPPPAHSAKPLPPLRPIDCLTARERRALTVLYPLTAAVVAGWTPLLMKQTLLLLQSAARGDAVHSSVAAWCVLLGTCLSGPIQLTCLAKGLRNVEAQLMVPAFASLFTICSILGAAAFFKVLLGCSLGGLAWLIAELPCALMSATPPPPSRPLIALQFRRTPPIDSCACASIPNTQGARRLLRRARCPLYSLGGRHHSWRALAVRGPSTRESRSVARGAQHAERWQQLQRRQHPQRHLLVLRLPFRGRLSDTAVIPRLRRLGQRSARPAGGRSPCQGPAAPRAAKA